jgi:hypothetical protein
LTSFWRLILDFSEGYAGFAGKICAFLFPSGRREKRGWPPATRLSRIPGLVEKLRDLAAGQFEFPFGDPSWSILANPTARESGRHAGEALSRRPGRTAVNPAGPRPSA